MDDQENDNKIAENLFAAEWDEEEDIVDSDINQFTNNDQQVSQIIKHNEQQTLTQEDEQLSAIEQALNQTQLQASPQPVDNGLQMFAVIENNMDDEDEEHDNGDDDDENRRQLNNQQVIFFVQMGKANQQTRPILMPNWLPIRTNATFKENEDIDEVENDNYEPNDEYMDTLRFGLKIFNETQALKRLEELSNKADSKEEVVSNRLNKDEFNVLSGNELSDLFIRFTFQARVVLSMVCPQWKQKLIEVFGNQSYLWLSKRYDLMPRFLPTIDCCESCHNIINEENSIMFVNASIDSIVNSLLVFTPNLKCIRITRFVMNNSKMIQQLGYICPQLSHIDFSECSQFNKSVAIELVTQFPNLRHLILANTGIDENFLEAIVRGLRKLVTLVVNCTRITGECLPIITSTIETLDTRNCTDLKSQSYQRFHTKFEHNNLIHFKANIGLDRNSFSIICETLKSLVSLELDNPVNNSDISNIDYTEIKTLCQLKLLKIGNGIDLKSLIVILKVCKQITSFSLVSQKSKCNQIPDTEFNKISDYCPHLERLELIGISTIGKLSIESISRLTQLYYLDMSSCVNIQDSYLSNFLSFNKSLTFVILDRCEKLSQQTLDSVIVKAIKMNNHILRVSMIRCDLKNMRYLKTYKLPNNLRLTFSSAYARRFCSFDGQRTRYGSFKHIYRFMNV